MDKYIEAWELIKAEINALHGEDSQIADDQKLEESIKLIDELLDDAEHNELVIHSLKQKIHTIDYDLGFLLEHIEVEEIKDIGMIEPDYKMHMSFPPFNYRQNCMRVHSMQCQWRERNKK